MFLITCDVLLLLTCIAIIGQNHPKISSIIICSIMLFFRKPDLSKMKKYNNGLVSPADGKIMRIIADKDKTTISIFLSIFDRHIQIAPIDGEIVNLHYKPGEFNAAHMFEKSKYNERLEIYMKTRIGTVIVVNYAGLLVRRIQEFIKKGENVKQNDLLSIIKFGSRVDVSFPNSIRVLLKENQRVKLGQLIGTLPN